MARTSSSMAAAPPSLAVELASRRVTVVELASAKGFAPRERDRALAAVSR